LTRKEILPWVDAATGMAGHFDCGKIQQMGKNAALAADLSVL
jgi:hypothetical protein